MRIVNVCGYDGTICGKYPVVVDEKGYIEPIELKCTIQECEHCLFIRNPWSRIELTSESKPNRCEECKHFYECDNTGYYEHCGKDMKDMFERR